MKSSVDRIIRQIDEISLIGGDKEEGVNRPAFSKADKQCKEYVELLMKSVGLDVFTDQAGNLIGRLVGRNPNNPSVVVGSHLDSVQSGGKYDGVLGVISGIECCRILKSESIVPVFPLEVVAFSDEEGRVTGGTFGSRAMMGKLSDSEKKDLSDNKAALYKMLSKANLIPEEVVLAKRDKDSIRSYLELHIEQGTVLEKSSIPIGIVTVVAGIIRFYVYITGIAGHAGTVPMHLRDDAVIKTAKLLVKINQLGLYQEGKGVVNAGNLQVKPGGFNIIPNWVKTGIEIRSNCLNTLQKMKTMIENMVSEHKGCLEEVSFEPPVQFDPCIREIIKKATHIEGLKWKEMPSGAGHDAVSFADVVPTGMIFIPCKDGKSHCPEELVHKRHIQEGLMVLLRCCRELCQ